MCTQGQPGQPLGHLPVLSQEEKSLEQDKKCPWTKNQCSWTLICIKSHRVKENTALRYSQDRSSLLYLASILVICFMISSIRWAAQPSMEPPSRYTPKCTFNTFVPLATGFPGSAFCNLINHSGHNLFPFTCFRLITWSVLPILLLTPKPLCKCCSGNFQCNFIGKDQLS